MLGVTEVRDDPGTRDNVALCFRGPCGLYSNVRVRLMLVLCTLCIVTLLIAFRIVGMGCKVELNIEGSVSKLQSNMRDDASYLRVLMKDEGKAAGTSS